MFFSLRLKQGNAVTIYNETLMKLHKERKEKERKVAGFIRHKSAF